MKNYSDIGLDSNLRKSSSLGGSERRKKFTTAYEFDAQMDNSIVSTPKVRSLRFDVLQGGTCSLGGTLDGDGVLSVSEQSGTEIVRIDKDGITINFGSITINDAAGSVIIDSNGLVGETAFSHGFTEKTSNQDITNTYSDIAELTHDIITTRTTPIFLYGMFVIAGTSTSAGITAVTRIAIVNDGGTTYSNTYPWNILSGTTLAGDNSSQLTVTTSVSLAAGTNTVKVEGKAGYAGTAVFAEDSNFGYIVLGK